MEVAVSLVCDDNVTMCGVWWRWALPDVFWRSRREGHLRRSEAPCSR